MSRKYASTVSELLKHNIEFDYFITTVIKKKPSFKVFSLQSYTQEKDHTILGKITKEKLSEILKFKFYHT